MCLSETPTSKQDSISSNMTTLEDLDEALSRIHSYSEIRLFIAGTANFGHQASSVDLLLRLVCDYAYAGLITVVYDRGNPGCGINVEKLPRLLQGYTQNGCTEMLPQKMHLARVKWLSIQDFAESTSELVDFGLTGGAEIGRIYHSSLADMLNVRTALIAQPFQWPWCRDGIDFHSTNNLPTVDLLGSGCLGWRLFHTAYRLPQSLHSILPQTRQRRNDSFLHCLLGLKEKSSGTWLSCVYGMREHGASHVDPANLLYIYFRALLSAFSQPSMERRNTLSGSRILVINFDKFWRDAFTRLEDYVHGRDPSSTSQNPPSLSKSGNLSHNIRCVHTLEHMPAAINWFQRPASQPTDSAFLAAADTDYATQEQLYSVKILYLHVGFVSPESFVNAVKQTELPIIFEGQHTASVVASLGKPYIKLRDSVLNSRFQVIRIPDDTRRHSNVIERIADASLSLQRGALGETELDQSVDCVASLIAECTDSTSQMNIYLSDLKSYYKTRGADKFEKLLSAWNKYARINPQEKIKSAPSKPIPKKTPRMAEELELDIQTVRKMLQEYSHPDGPLSEVAS